MSRFWSYYQDKDQHNAIWDAAVQATSGLGLKANQTFLSKTIKNADIGANQSVLNDPVKFGLTKAGVTTGERQNIGIAEGYKDFLPILKGTADVLVDNPDLDYIQSLPKSEYYIRENELTQRLEYITESGDVSGTYTTEPIYKSYGDLMFVAYNRQIHVYQAQQTTPHFVLLSTVDIKQQDGSTNITDDIYDFVYANGHVFMACGDEGLIIYQIQISPFNMVRVNPEATYDIPLDRILIDGSYCFVTGGIDVTIPITETYRVYILDVAIPSVVINHPDIIISTIEPFVSGGTDQNAPIEDWFVDQYTLGVIRSGGTDLGELYDYSSIQSPSFITGSLNFISPPDPFFTTYYSMKFNRNTNILASVWGNGSEKRVFIYDFGNVRSPILSTPAGLDRLYDDVIDYDIDVASSTYAVLGTVGASQQFFFYDVGNLQEIKLLSSNGFPDTAIDADSFEFNYLQVGVYYSSTSDNLHHFSYDFGHNNQTIQTFDDLSLIESKFFVELNEVVYNDILVNDFEGWSWNLSLDQNSGRYVLEITGLDTGEFLGDDKVFFSETLKVGEGGDYIRLFDNGVDGFINLPNPTPPPPNDNYSLDFFIILDGNILDDGGNTVQNKVYVVVDWKKVPDAVYNQIHDSAGMSGTGLSFYRNFTTKQIVLRDELPLPIFRPNMLIEGENTEGALDPYHFRRITQATNNLSVERYALIKPTSTENLVTELGSNFPVDHYVMFAEDKYNGRFKIEAVGSSVLVLSIDSLPAPQPEDNFGIYPTPSFTKQFRDSSDQLERVTSLDHNFITNQTAGTEIRLEFQAGSVVNLDDYIGKVATFSTTTPTDSPAAQYVVVEASPADSETDQYIILAEYISGASFYDPGAIGTQQVYFWQVPPLDSAQEFFVGKKDASIVSGSSYQKLFDVYLGFYYVLMNIDNDEGRFFENIPELKTTVLFDLDEFANEVTYTRYSVEDGDDVTRKYSEHNGLIVFGEPVGESLVYAPNAHENVSVLSNVFAPVVGAKEGEPDSTGYKKQVQAMMYTFSQGPDFNIMETGLNVFGGVPTNIDEETVVTEVSDKNYVMVQSLEDNLFTEISLEGYEVRPEILPGTKLAPFQALTRKIEVKDEVNNPRWWDLDYISILSPLKSYQTASFNQEERRVMNEVLKHNAFGVKVDADVVSQSGSSTIPEINSFVNQIKPTWMHGFIYSRLDFVNQDILEFEDSIEIELRIIVNATIFANLRNKYFDQDDPIVDGIDFDISRQNSFHTLEFGAFIMEDLAAPGVYTGWSEAEELFEINSVTLGDPDYGIFIF